MDSPIEPPKNSPFFSIRIWYRGDCKELSSISNRIISIRNLTVWLFLLVAVGVADLGEHCRQSEREFTMRLLNCQLQTIVL